MGKAIPTYKGEGQYLEDAKRAFCRLTEDKIKRLRSISRHSSARRISGSYINEHILPTMYEYQLFTGSDYWLEGLIWLEQNIDKASELDLDKTLILLTSALAGSEDGFGADYWYRKGITSKLIDHLIYLHNSN